MDGTRGYYAKQNKSVRERQLSYDFTHMWSLSSKTEDLAEGREKYSKMKSEKETNHKRLLTIGNKLRVTGGEVGEGMG